MNKGEVVRFMDLQVGDCVSDNARQKFRKIPQFDLNLELPDVPSRTFNAFHFQSHSMIFINPSDEFTFISHSDWVEKKHFELSVEESELEHQLEFFTNYFEVLKTSLNSVETSNDFFDPDESFSSHEVDEFTNLMRSSFFVSLYSYLEARLNNECQNSQQDNPQKKILLDDIHGRGITRAKTYLVKVLDTSFPFDEDANWKQIQWFSKIRNCIVHNEGKVSDKVLKKSIETHPDLHCEMFFGSDFVILDEGFCENAIAVIGAFLQSLMYHREADKIS